MTNDADTVELLQKMLVQQGFGRIAHIEARAALARARELLPIIEALMARNDLAQARQRLHELARTVASTGECLNTAGGHFSRTRRLLEHIVDETSGQ
jgi:hypothetical protein